MRGDVKKAQFVEMVISKLIRLKKSSSPEGSKNSFKFCNAQLFSIFFLLRTFVVKKLSFKIKNNFAIILKGKKITLQHIVSFYELNS